MAEQTHQQAETPAERTMRRFYEGRLAERLAQFGEMIRSRALLRRGARKMQDGTLGQATSDAVEDEEMNIRIGDEVHYHQPEAGTASPTALPAVARRFDWVRRAAVAAALLATGAGSAAALLQLLPSTDPPAAVDTNTEYELQLGQTRPAPDP